MVKLLVHAHFFIRGFDQFAADFHGRSDWFAVVHVEPLQQLFHIRWLPHPRLSSSFILDHSHPEEIVELPHVLDVKFARHPLLDTFDVVIVPSGKEVPQNMASCSREGSPRNALDTPTRTGLEIKTTGNPHLDTSSRPVVEPSPGGVRNKIVWLCQQQKPNTLLCRVRCKKQCGLEG